MWMIRSSRRRTDGRSSLSTYVIGVSFIAATGGFIFGYDVGVSGGVTVMEDFLCEFFPRVLKDKIAREAPSYGHHRCGKINGTAMEHFQRSNSSYTREMTRSGDGAAGNHTGMNVYCQYDNQVVQLFTSSLYLTAMVVTFVAGVVTRRHGRRASMLLASAFFALGSAVNAAAINRGTLICGRIIFGCGVGFGNQVVPLFLSEIAPTGSRGGVNNLFQLFVTIGILTANIVNVGAQHVHAWGWRLSLALPLIPALALMVGSLLIVDTPNSLVERGKYEQARQALIRLRAGSGAPCDDDRINAAIKDLHAASSNILYNSLQHIESTTADQHHYSPLGACLRACFGRLLERHNRPPLLISIFVQMFQQFTGINAIMMYSPVLFNSLGGPFLNTQGAALYSAIIIGTINVLATLIALFLVDRVGRRALLLEASVQMCIAQVLIGIILAKSSVESGKLPKSAAIVVLISICGFVSAFAWSWGPLGWLISTEIFPLTTRSQGQSVSVCSNMLFTFLVAQTTLTSICHLEYGFFLFFGTCIFITGVVTYCFLPETMGIDIELMPTIWVHHWFWKRYFFPSPHDQPSHSSQKTREIVLNGMAPEQSNTSTIFPTSYLAPPN